MRSPRASRTPWINAAHYVNPEVDALFRQAAEEPDDARRAAQFQAIQRIVGRDLPSLPLTTASLPQLRHVKVKGLYNSVDLTSGDFADAWIAR